MMMEEEDDHIILEEKIVIEEEEIIEEVEAEPEKIVKFRGSADDDVLEMGAGDEGLEDLREAVDNLREVIEEGSVEDGEIEEEKRKSKTLRVHLPDLLQGIDNDDDDAFTTSENIERLAKRAARFNIENDLSNDDLNAVLKSLNIPYEERERRAQGRYRLDHIELYGVFSMSFEDLQDYFDDLHLEDYWTHSDDYGIIKFRQDINAFRAILKMSKPIGEPKKEERIIKHVLTADDASPERKVITKETKDEFDKMVHPDDIPIEMPEGKWRYGKHHKKCGAILMRFPLKTTLKTKKKGHYLQNDRSDRTRNVEPQDLEDIEQQEREERKNFNPKDPWSDLSQKWAKNGETGEREYVMSLSSLDRPPARLATGRRDWDAPKDENHPVQIRPPRESRKRKYSEEESEPKTFFEETQEISDSEGSDESSGEEDWRKKLKKPRLGMVADIEEAKQKNTVRDRLKGGGGGGPAKRLKTSEGPRLKRQISNNYVVSEKIIVESSDDDFNDPALIEEAKNDDLRHHLTMRVENKPTGRPILKATKRLTNRFAGADSEEEDKDFAFENMRIEIRGDENSDDDTMDVDEPQDARTKLKQRREAKENIDHRRHQTDLRDRMSRDRKSADVGQSSDRKSSDVGQSRDRKRTDSGQSRDRKRTDSGQPRDRKSADAGSSRDRKRERRDDMDVDAPRSRDKVRSPVVDDLRKRMSSKSSKSVKVKDEYEEDRRKEKNKKDKSKGTLDDEREGVEDQIRELKDVKAQEKQLLDKLNEKLKRMEQDKEELRRKSIKSAEAKERAARDKTRREPQQAPDRRRRKSTERRRSVEDRTSRKSDATASKRRKRSPSSSSDSDDYSSSSSESDESSSDNDSASSSSDSSSDSSSSDDESSSSSSDSESSSGEESSPDRKKKHKSSSSRNKKESKTSSSASSKRKPTSAKTSSKSDDKKSTKPQQSRAEDKKSSSSSNKKSEGSSAKQSAEDKKKDADLKAKLENFVKKSKTKKDKK